MPVEPHVGDAALDTVPQAIAQRREADGFRRHVPAPNLDRTPEPDDARHVLGARAPPALVLAAVLDRYHLRAFADVQTGHALWTVDLVAGERQEVDAERV